MCDFISLLKIIEFVFWFENYTAIWYPIIVSIAFVRKIFWQLQMLEINIKFTSYLLLVLLCHFVNSRSSHWNQGWNRVLAEFDDAIPQKSTKSVDLRFLMLAFRVLLIKTDNSAEGSEEGLSRTKILIFFRSIII